MAEVKVDVSDPGDLWADKEELARRDWEARQFWAELVDDERAGIGLLVHDALLRLLREPQTWLPAACTAGKRLDITISILLDDFDRATLLGRVQSERAAIRRGSALMELERRYRNRQP